MEGNKIKIVEGERNRHDLLDIVRWIMSIFVMILHCVPDLTLYDQNYLTFGLLQMPLRIAVPFFF